MKILLDTNYVIWIAEGNISPKVQIYINNPENSFYFSPASIWEIIIKKQSQRDFRIEPFALRLGLVEHGYIELPITSMHTLLVNELTPIHKDPFDRLLIAQAKAEGMLLLTADKIINQYDAPVLYCPRNRSSRKTS
ncbi:MAG: type II toxin-antitoxin system VapC family toxin [Candidatus Margulisbacteria bacterium]|jgi:PIN domain nuclease of toxin-antitoxin system|nr:type II toxin-antitoxin system VapC family toxin [Candidatus Margulisiibacteriota bacterium]